MSNKLMDLTMVDLKEKAVKLGFDAEDVKSFNNKKQVVGVIEALSAKKTIDLQAGVATEKPKLVDPAISAKETKKEKKSSDKSWLSKQARMGRHLEKQPKVGIMIQLEVGEKEGVVDSKVVNGIREFKIISGSVKEKIINGYKWILPKGIMTKVPEQIYELLSRELNVMAKLGTKHSTDRLDPKTGKPVSDALR